MGTKLNNAPVFYALAHVQFNPVEQLLPFVLEVQKAFAELGYSEMVSKEMSVISLLLDAPDSAPSVWTNDR